jgi:uncharacterized membrane protein YgcG
VLLLLMLMMKPNDNRAKVMIVIPVDTKKKTDKDDDGGRQKKRIRKVHSLPLELAMLTKYDGDKFNWVLEIDDKTTHNKSRAAAAATTTTRTCGQQEFWVAKSVTIIPSSSTTTTTTTTTTTNGNDPLSLAAAAAAAATAAAAAVPMVFDLCSVSVDHLRKLCANLGILNAGSLSKFNCRKAIAICFRKNQEEEESSSSSRATTIDIQPTTATTTFSPHAASSSSSRVTSSVCRAVNVVFSADFVKEFQMMMMMMMNNQKLPQQQQDHETKKKNRYKKAFWIRAALAYNACMETTTTTTTTTVREDESEIVLVEKATLPATRNGEKIVGLAAAPTAANNDDDNNHGSDSFQSSSSSSSSSSSGGGGKPLAVDNGVREQEDKGGTLDDFGTILVSPVNDIHLLELASDPTINLFSVDHYDTKAYTKMIMALLTVRKKMLYNMTVSGTHDNDPWHFVENAMLGTTTTTAVGGLTKISVYYFYQRCMDSNVQPFLDDVSMSMMMKGDDSVNEWDDTDDSPAISGSTRKDADNRAIQDMESTTTAAAITTIRKGMLDLQSTLQKHFKSSEKLAKKSMKFHARLEVAKALGNQDELLQLMEEAKSWAEE